MAEFVGFVSECIRLTLLAYVVFAFLAFAIAWLFDGIGGPFRAKLAKLSKKKRVLLITAHPDDECMFFSPLILHRIAQRAGRPSRVFLLCLTNGDFYKLGKEREKELMDSCSTLGIPLCNVVIVHHEKLEDNPTKEWNVDVLEEQLHLEVDKIKPDLIFTFDEYGISGHKNHIAIHRAVRNILQDPGIRFKGVEAAYYLDSVNCVRKYIGLLDFPLALVFSENIIVLGPLDILRAQRAMVAHSTQLVWFRIVYIIMSRYMMFNSFRVQKNYF